MALHGFTRIAGITLLLLVVCIYTTVENTVFVGTYNLSNLMRVTALFGILGLGVAFVIITGGIDLSIGAVVVLTGIVMMELLQEPNMNPYLALAITLGVGMLVGLLHGVLIGYCKLQPFIVTLCGLMGYRGIAQLISGDKTLSLHPSFNGLREIAIGKAFDIPVPFIHSIYTPPGETDAGLIAWVPLPIPMLILLVLAVVGAVFLHKTVPGRYLLAMGRNEEAARFSGINTRRMTILAYVICSTLAALGGILFALDVNTVQPSSHGNFYELYAIAAAVLGGCSLRGGVGSITGVIIGTAVMRSLYNAINLLEKPTYWEYVIIGGVLLAGVMIDELGRQLVGYIKTRRRREKLALAKAQQE